MEGTHNMTSLFFREIIEQAFDYAIKDKKDF